MSRQQRSINRGLSYAQWLSAIALASLVGIAIKTVQDNRIAIQFALEGFTRSPLFFWGCVALGVLCVAVGVALVLVHRVPLNPGRLLREPRR